MPQRTTSPPMQLGQLFSVHRSFLVVAFCILLVSSASAATTRIMPLGDSITTGITNTGVYAWTGNGTFSFGYRGPLYTKLTNASGLVELFKRLMRRTRRI